MRTRTASPVVVPPRPLSPIFHVAGQVIAPPIFHSRPPPPVPQLRPYIRPEFAPPPPWCNIHPIVCYPQDCQQCALRMAWHNQFGHWPASMRE
eukprot:6953622-Heterocapsa_arctica.AAC.1